MGVDFGCESAAWCRERRTRFPDAIEWIRRPVPAGSPAAIELAPPEENRRWPVVPRFQAYALIAESWSRNAIGHATERKDGARDRRDCRSRTSRYESRARTRRLRMTSRIAADLRALKRHVLRGIDFVDHAIGDSGH